MRPRQIILKCEQPMLSQMQELRTFPDVGKVLFEIVQVFTGQWLRHRRSLGAIPVYLGLAPAPIPPGAAHFAIFSPNEFAQL